MDCDLDLTWTWTWAGPEHALGTWTWSWARGFARRQVGSLAVRYCVVTCPSLLQSATHHRLHGYLQLPAASCQLRPAAHATWASVHGYLDRAQSAHMSMAWQGVSSFCHHPGSMGRKQGRGEGRRRLAARWPCRAGGHREGDGPSQWEPALWAHVAEGTRESLVRWARG